MMVVFDVDGTLFDTKKEIISAMNIVLDRHGIMTIVEDEDDYFIGLSFRETLPKYRGISVETADDLLLEFREEYREHIVDSELYLGAENLLHELKKSEIKVGIATNKPYNQVKILLDSYKVFECFDVIKTRDEYDRAKSQMLLEIKDEFPDMDRYFMVGDTMEDLNAAAESGFKFIEAAYGYGKFKTRNTYRAYCIGDVAKIVLPMMYEGSFI